MRSRYVVVSPVVTKAERLADQYFDYADLASLPWSQAIGHSRVTLCDIGQLDTGLDSAVTYTNSKVYV